MTWTGLRKRILAGEYVYGTMIRQARDPGAPSIYAAAGFDFVFIDMEHGNYSMETVADLICGAKSAGIAPMIRVPHLETHFISRVLDAGAEGIMVPMTSRREQAETIVRYSKYTPIGQRGFGAQTGQTDYKPLKALEFMKEANDHTVIIAQIETREAIENIDAIISVEGIDVGLIGPNDLSISLGIPDQMGSDVLKKAIDKVVETAKKRGKATGIHIGNIEAIKTWRTKGMTVLAYSTDISFQYNASKSALEGLKKS
ncbi:MAG TPA: aldolase/citrate lyase family protein [Thermodesulfobacteriota bacterium]|nr:aldolase/citrate lyase family protein [Thermodesulfobacteriota bacterium]